MEFANISPMEINAASQKNVASRLKFLRLHFRMSQAQFAPTVGATPKQYNNWETGDQMMPLVYAVRINERYGISMDFVYLGRFHALPSDIADAWIRSTDPAPASAASASSDAPVQ